LRDTDIFQADFHGRRSGNLFRGRQMD